MAKTTPKKTKKSRTPAKAKTAKPKAAKTAAELDFVPVRSREVLSRRNSDGSVAIIRLDSDQYFFTLDGVSAEIWDLIDGKSEMAKIVEKMVKKHSLPEDRFKKDVKRLVSDLRKERLIH